MNCPKCGGGLLEQSDDLFKCSQCSSLFKRKVKTAEAKAAELPYGSNAESAQKPSAQQYVQSGLEYGAASVGDGFLNSSIDGAGDNSADGTGDGTQGNAEKGADTREVTELRERLARMEAQQAELLRKQNSPNNTRATIIEFIKKRGKLLFPAVLVFIVAIILMVCFVGVRGVYVSADNPNLYYEFTATGYKCVGEDPWGEYSVEGKWRVSGGKLILSVADEDFGTVTEDYKFSRNGYQTIFIDEEEFNRVSLVGLKLASKITVKIDLQGGSATGNTASSRIMRGTKLNAPQNSSKDGYSFAGWYASPYGYFDGETAFSFDNKLWENCTIYANWRSTAGYTVSGVFDSFETTPDYKFLPVIASIERGVSGTYQYRTSTGSQWVTIDQNTRIPNANIELRRINEFNRAYAITLDPNGGTVAEQTKSITYNSSFTLPVPARAGYLFNGWYTSSSGGTRLTDGTGKSIFNSILDSKTTVYAHWGQSGDYALTLNKSHAAGTVSGGGEVHSGTVVTVSASNIDDFTWLGWYDGKGKLTEDRMYSFTMPAESVTLQAKWGGHLTVSKNIENAGTVSGSSGVFAAGASCTVTATTKAGYNWLGWYNGGIKLTGSLSYSFLMPDSNISLQAKWSGYLITLYKNITAAGTVSGDGEFASGASRTLTATTNSGYTWLGWYDDDVLTKVSSGTSLTYTFTMPAQNKTYTARWQWNGQNEYAANGYYRIENYIWFGEHPQTIKANDVTITETTDSRGYYLGSDGYYYAKVTATPNNSNYKFSTNATVTSGTAYYFKVEPIKWRILEESDGTALILCESIIANKRYHASSNNYMNSEIRAWLNNEFYNTAFSALQKELIQITNVDNSAYSTGFSSNPYACANTNDKIFLPSYRDMVNTAFGFSSRSDEYDTARRRLTSDYSRATGAYMNTSTEYYGNGWWWLRSPNDFRSNGARCIDDSGYAGADTYVNRTSGGVVPALKIRLS